MISIQCNKCGYIHETRKNILSDFFDDPIGFPFIQCPVCHELHADPHRKVWVQLSPIKKFFSVTPRGNYLAGLLSLPLGFLLGRWLGGSAFLYVSAWILAYAVCQLTVTAIRANSHRFRDRISSSIARTRNDEYAKVLSKYGKLYGEFIPSPVFFTEKSEYKLAIEIDQIRRRKDTISIPSFFKRCGDE